MNKKAIWGIIGLMSVALMGIIVLQAYWINERLRLEEDYFNKAVFSVLNQVSKKLEREEQTRRDQILINPKNTKGYLNADKSGANPFANDGPMSFRFFANRHKLDTASLFAEHTDLLECNCIQCEQKRFETLEHSKRAWLTNQLINPDPVEERIRVEHLDTWLKQGLLSRDIDLDYNYGVYSPEKEAFVIQNGKYNYVASEGGDFGTTAVTIPDLDDLPKEAEDELQDSRYTVQLFQEYASVKPAGFLMIHFPGKTGFVWRSVWTTVLAAILFTGIILFCFIYTMQVIFTQKKLSKMKSDFINNMTHEFKTPIATISLASDSITSPMISGNPAKVQRFANIIKQENQRMNKQVEKVLQMALLDKKDFQLKLTQVDAHEVVRQAVANIGLRAEQKGGKATAQLNAVNSYIEADVTHFSNVINNLLDNAFKYSPENPTITVTTANVASGITIKIKDNGIGMSNEDRKHIFDKFFRVHTGNRHDVKGFGLGLSYVKAILNSHKGQISVKSELGKGSEFTLFFPYHVNQS